MKTIHLRARYAILALMVVMLLALPASALAGDAAEVFTMTWHNATETLPADVNPCNGVAAEIDLTYNGVLHVTTLPDGNYQFVLHQTGVWEGPAGVGRYTVGIEDIFNRNGETHTYVFSSHAAPAGLEWHIIARAVMDANGEVKLTFDRLTCK